MSPAGDVPGGRFRLFEHTADVGVLATGPTLAVAFAAVVRGMASVTYDLRRVRPREERVVRARAADPARLLVHLLDEVLFLEDTEGFIPRQAAVRLDPPDLEARLRGEPFDPARHRRAGQAVKAVTYHQISIESGPPARVRVILDI